MQSRRQRFPQTMLYAHSPAGGAGWRSRAGHSSMRTTCNYNRGGNGVEPFARWQAKRPDFGRTFGNDGRSKVIGTEIVELTPKAVVPRGYISPVVQAVRVAFCKGLTPPGTELPAA